jgi:hypothetical protein
MCTGPGRCLLESLQDGRDEAGPLCDDAATNDKGVPPVRDAVDNGRAGAVGAQFL